MSGSCQSRPRSEESCSERQWCREASRAEVSTTRATWASARLVAVGSLLLAGMGSAATLTVRPESAYSGASGLELVVGSTCTLPDDTLDLSAPSYPALSGVYEACFDITTETTEVVSPGATLRAGRSITLGPGFTVLASALFTAELDASLGTSFAYVEDRSLFEEIRYNARFRLRLDGLTIGAADSVDHLVGYSESGVLQFRVVLERDDVLGTDLLLLAARQDDGGWVQTAEGGEQVLPPGWALIEVSWAAGSGDGSLLVSVDGGPPAGLTALDNDTVRLGLVRWGAVAGAIDGTFGSIDMDDFESWR